MILAYQKSITDSAPAYDTCIHVLYRLAPLSQGRIDPDDGSLQCSYHGAYTSSAHRLRF